MPRDFEDDEEPVSKPRKGAAKTPARDLDDEPGSALKPLLITLGCVLVAFGGIMAYVLLTKPKAGEVARRDPTSNPDPTISSPGGISNPNDQKNPKADPNAPKPDDWTPPPFTRPASPLASAESLTFIPDAAVPPLNLGWVGMAAYLDTHGLLLTAEGLGDRFAVYDTNLRRELPTAVLKQFERVQVLSAAPDQSVAFAQTRDRILRFTAATRSWEAVQPDGPGSCLALSADRFLMIEEHAGVVVIGQKGGGAFTQLRLCRWDSGTVTVTAKWTVSGRARASYDAATGSLWVARAAEFGKGTADLDQFTLTGTGGTLRGTTPLPFPISQFAHPVISPTPGLVYVADRAVENGQVRAAKYPGQVTAAFGTRVVLSDGTVANADTAANVGKAWADDLTALSFSADQSTCWAYNYELRS